MRKRKYMTADLYKRLYRAIFSSDINSLKKIAYLIIESERKIGHVVLANELEKIAIQNSPLSNTTGLKTLPVNKRDNAQLVSMIAQDQLKHHMILPLGLEERFQRIEKEYTARERLRKYNLLPKKKILLYGPPGCGKTLSAERLAWNLGLPLVKVRFDSLLSSYFGESASNLRNVFEYCKREKVVLLLDECDFIAKSRINGQDVGEVPRIVNMLLLLLDEYDAPGLVIATTNLKVTLDQALFRRFDDIIELDLPNEPEIKKLLVMTLSAIKTDPEIDWDVIAKSLVGNSYAKIDLIAQNAAKFCVLDNSNIVTHLHIKNAIDEIRFKF